MPVPTAGEGKLSGSPNLSLYSSSPQGYEAHPVAIKAIPYYANANRGPVDMAVWLPYAT